MSVPWIFTPNCLANVWFSPSDPTTDPPDLAGIDCQQLKPFYYAAPGVLPPVLVHRFILTLADVGNVGSTVLHDGMFMLILDAAGDNIGWFQMNDLSPFAYVDPILGPTWTVIMFSGRLVNF